MITHVKLVSIPVKDQVKAFDFYTQKLGFEVKTDVPMGNGKRWIKLLPPGSTTSVVLFTTEGQEDRVGTFSNVVFATDDVEKSYQELKSRGVEFSEEPKKEPWGTYTKFKDPDGNEFVLASAD